MSQHPTLWGLDLTVEDSGSVDDSQNTSFLFSRSRTLRDCRVCVCVRPQASDFVNNWEQKSPAARLNLEIWPWWPAKCHRLLMSLCNLIHRPRSIFKSLTTGFVIGSVRGLCGNLGMLGGGEGRPSLCTSRSVRSDLTDSTEGSQGT